MFRSVFLLAITFSCAVPAAAQQGALVSPFTDMGGNLPGGNGLYRYVNGKRVCTFAVVVSSDQQVTLYVVDICTHKVIKKTPLLFGQQQEENGSVASPAARSNLAPALSSGNMPQAVGSEPFTLITLADSSQLAAYTFGTDLETGSFPAGSDTAQTTGQYPTGTSPKHVIAGDFNGDGNMDLAVSNFGPSDDSGGNLQIYLGNGTGSFTAGATVNAGVTPVALYAADFNGDGKLDLAAANVTANTVSAMLGKGDGTFQAPVSYPLPSSPQSLVAGDFNGDSKLDLAVAGYGGGVSILLGNGNGTFQTAQAYSTGSTQSTYLARMDLNGDGKPDLIVANPLSNSISFLFGNGDGSFQAPVQYATGADPQYFALLTNNGQVGIATADDLSGDICLMLVQPNGTAGAPVIYTLPQAPTGIAAGDLNGDGFPDIVSANGAVSVLLRAPGGGFGLPVNYSLQSNSQAVAVAVADLNGDGKNDVAAASIDQTGSGGTLDLALNTGNGTLGTQSSYTLGGYPGGNGGPPSGIVAGDFNGDGKPDIAVGYQPAFGTGASGVSVFLNKGGSFASAVNYPLSGSSVFATIAGDFNGDGKPDLAVAVGGSGFSTLGNLAILIANADGTFQNAKVTPVGSPAGTPVALAAADLNHDGRTDIVASVWDSNLNEHIVVLLGNGDSTFRQLTPFTTPAHAQIIALPDLNGDGIPDLVVGDCCGESESVYLLGNGDGTFRSPIYFSSGSAVTGFAVTSWNHNGVAGLAIAQQGGSVEAIESTLDPKLYGNPPTLSISKTHTGNFAVGQNGATYTITVSNAAHSAPVAGTVTVTDTLPSGLTLVSMAGNNWICSANTCSRGDALAGGAGYDPITVTVNVNASATSPQVNMASVGGGGAASASTTDSTIIGGGTSCTYSLIPPPPMPPIFSAAGNGTVMVNTQPGCSWAASSNAPWLTLSSGSSGTGGGSVTYSASANTEAERTGSLTIAGIAFPVTQLAPPTLSISSSHTGNFFQGETGASYSVVVSNAADASPALGTLTVTETLPTGLTLVAMTGTGWTCSGNTCTVSATLLSGASLPAISVTVNVAANASSQVTNQVSVSGAGSATASAGDVTSIVAATCSFSLGGSGASLSQTGTASTGGVLPEVPVAVTATPAAGATCTGTYQGLSSDSWLSASGTPTGFTYTALTNPHPSSRTATLTITNPSGGTATFTVNEAGNPEPLLNRQVRALYQSVLGRDPDLAGFTFWTGIGSTGLGQMLDSFLTSPEAYNSDFAAMAVYQAATGAPPSYAQFLAAVANLRSGTDLTTLFTSVLPPGYATPNLYQNLLQRQPAAGEIQNANPLGLPAVFQNLIAYPSSTTPVSAPNNEFMNTGTFASAPDHSNALYIALLYYVILNRDHDQAGYNFWVGVANSGGPGVLFQGANGYPTRIQILGPGTPEQGFAGSPEFQSLYQ